MAAVSIGRSMWDGMVFSWPLGRVEIGCGEIKLMGHRTICLHAADGINIQMRKRLFFKWFEIIGGKEFPYLGFRVPRKSARVKALLKETGFLVSEEK